MDIEIDGTITSYRCLRAPDIRDAITEGEPVGDPPTVLLSKQWGVLFLPLGAKGSSPSTVIGFFPGVSHIDGGSATEAFTSNDGYRLRIFSIGRI